MKSNTTSLSAEVSLKYYFVCFRPLITFFVMLFFFTFNVATLSAKVWPLNDSWSPVGNVTVSDLLQGGDNGDGVNDGSILVNGQSAVTGQGIQYRFHGKLENNESINVSTTLYNVNSSYCLCRVELYNETDNRVLASQNVTLVANSNDILVNLSATAGGSDVGDSLVLRYIRTDDGNTARDFVIDNAVMDGWYFPGASPNRRTPDLPELPNDVVLQSEINQILDNWYQSNMPTAPTQAELNAAIAQYNALGISNTGGVQTGTISSWSSVSFLDVFAKELHHNPTNQDIINRANVCIQAMGEALFIGQISDDYNGYVIRHFYRDAMLLKNHLNQTSLEYLDYIFDVNFKEFVYIWSPNYPFNLTLPTINTDDVYNKVDSLMIYSLGFQSSDVQAQRWARGFSRYCDRFCTPGPGTSDGIKADGSGFHHWTDYSSYMYAYDTFVTVLSSLGDTSLQVSIDKYENFRDAFISQFIRSRDGIKPLSLTGRSPQSLGISVSQSALKSLALVGGKVLNNGASDPDLAGLYNYIYGFDPSLGTTSVDGFEGAFQYNYSSTLTHRGQDWTAVIRGFNDYFWGAELYPVQNRYGRYQNYGTLEILNKGGALANGIDRNGWDWNYPDGATTIVLPFTMLHGEKSRIDEYQNESFVGASTLSNKGSEILSDTYGSHGIFGMEFNEKENQGFSTVFGPNTHNGTFRFKKSTFTFSNGLIVSLGSDISNNDGNNITATTLFQKMAQANSEVRSSSGNYTTQGNRTLSSGANRWMVDPYGTGYVVPQGTDSIRLDWGIQNTPPQSLTNPSDLSQYQSGEFVKAYIDHGSAPTSKGYEYAVLPNTTSSDVSSFSSRLGGAQAQRPYVVLAKNSNQHIVCCQDTQNKVWGLVLFEPSTTFPASSMISRNDKPALVMYEELASGNVLLSVTDPDLGLNAPRTYSPALSSTVSLDLRGKWDVMSASGQVQSSFVNGGVDTRLTVNLEKGMPEELLLSNSNYESWAGGFFTQAEVANGIGMRDADPDGDGLPNLFEFAAGSDPTQTVNVPQALGMTNASPSEFQFMFAGNRAGILATVQTSTDLVTWTDIYQSVGAAVFTPLTGGYTITDQGQPRMVTVAAQTETDERFYRVKVVEAP